MPEPSEERRRHKRHDLSCPAGVSDGSGHKPASGKTLNISDGGLLVPLAAEDAPQPGAAVRVRFSVPRQTPNTFMLEDFSAAASVVRLADGGDGEQIQIALRFDKPLELGLDE